LKVLIVNTHSVLNPGDCAIVLAQIQFLKTHFSNLSITLTSRTPELDKMFYGPMGINVLPPFMPAPSVFIGGRGPQIAQSVQNLLSLQTKHRLVKAIIKSDIVISSGGGYFFSNRDYFPGPMFFQNILPLKLATLFNKPVILFPQSFGPLHNYCSTRFLKNVLSGNTICKIFTREQISYNLSINLLSKNKNKLKVAFCPDMTFYLNTENNNKTTPSDFDLPKPIIAVTVRQWDFPLIKDMSQKEKAQEIYLTTLTEACNKLFHLYGCSIVILPQTRGPGTFEDDTNISKDLFNRLHSLLPDNHLLYIKLPLITSPLHIIDILSQVDVVIATRFHSSIFALLKGVPVISITYQPKSTGIMAQMDLDQFCVDISEINPDRICHLVGLILNRYSYFQNNIKNTVTEIRNVIEAELGEAVICLKEF